LRTRQGNPAKEEFGKWELCWRAGITVLYEYGIMEIRAHLRRRTFVLVTIDSWYISAVPTIMDYGLFLFLHMLRHARNRLSEIECMLRVRVRYSLSTRIEPTGRFSSKKVPASSRVGEVWAWMGDGHGLQVVPVLQRYLESARGHADLGNLDKLHHPPPLS